MYKATRNVYAVVFDITVCFMTLCLMGGWRIKGILYSIYDYY